MLRGLEKVYSLTQRLATYVTPSNFQLHANAQFYISIFYDSYRMYIRGHQPLWN